MRVIFEYNEDKDIECLLAKGAGSKNQPGSRTKAYEALLRYTLDPSDRDRVKEFVRRYHKEQNIDVENVLRGLGKNWDGIAEEFTTRAESIFGTTLPGEITAYLTIAGRYPYSIEGKYFYVSAKKENANATAMHELWHFYTWHGLGADQEEKLGKQKYNDLKETLTVLLNVECADLFPGGVTDLGYPQHKELREKIPQLWRNEKNIKKLWEHLCHS